MGLKQFLFGKISRKIFFGFLIIALFLGIIAGIGNFYMDKIGVAETPGEMYQLTNNTQTLMLILILNISLFDLLSYNSPYSDQSFAYV